MSICPPFHQSLTLLHSHSIMSLCILVHSCWILCMLVHLVCTPHLLPFVHSCTFLSTLVYSCLLLPTAGESWRGRRNRLGVWGRPTASYEDAYQDGRHQHTFKELWAAPLLVKANHWGILPTGKCTSHGQHWAGVIVVILSVSVCVCLSQTVCLLLLWLQHQYKVHVVKVTHKFNLRIAVYLEISAL